MKKIFLLLVLTVVIASCKKTEEKQSEKVDATVDAVIENVENIKQYSGEFLYIANAAVLKGQDFIYGVTIDEMTQKLADQVEPIKNDPYDMVPVIIKGIVKSKAIGAQGWDEIITIKEILIVSPTPVKADIKFEEKKS